MYIYLLIIFHVYLYSQLDILIFLFIAQGTNAMLWSCIYFFFFLKFISLVQRQDVILFI